MRDIYLERLVNDLGEAEKQLRDDINYRGISFSQQRLDDSQANVDRLHEIITKYLLDNSSTREGES